MAYGSNGRWRGSWWWGAGAFGALAVSTPSAAPAAARAAAPAPVVTVRMAPAEAPEHVRELRRALAGMLVAIDPATGELRAPTAAEHEALTGSAATQTAFAAPQPIDLPGGGSLVLTSAANVDFLTAVRGEDGTIGFRCRHGLDAAAATFTRDHQSPGEEVLR